MNTPHDMPQKPAADSPQVESGTSPGGGGTPGKSALAAPRLPTPGTIDLERYSTGLKLVLIFFLVLGFLIPLWMLTGLTGERQQRRNQAAAELARAWAGPLTLATPVLVLPCDYRYRDSQDREAIGTRAVIIQPNQLNVEGRLDPQVRQRGIFSIPLFTMDATLAGSFRRPELAALGADVVRARWDRAYLALFLPDYRSLAESPQLQWNDQTLALGSPRPDMELGGPALCASLQGLDWNDAAAFSIRLALKGSDQVSIHSLAETTQARVESSWSSPSFFGSALPDSRSISEKGMQASWRQVRYGQGLCANAPLSNGLIDGQSLLNGADSGDGFGFRLYQNNSVYQLTDRSLKYGILFIIIPFTALFLIEALRRIRVHPVQYLLIGAANCLFFLLLLALSEQISFNPSYLLAAVVTIALSAWYCSWILPHRSDGWLMAGLLAALYGYMFTALQSEDYALLIGSAGLVLIVAAVMFSTRKIDWYRLGKHKA